LAVESRTIIGQAEGILMERLGIDAQQALEYLKRASSTSNRKLAQIAAEIAETRKLPELD
jgi:AmiR/NasT family two-component response regulator